jgi:5-methylcytosine-specific restriction endonuclease McrA
MSRRRSLFPMRRRRSRRGYTAILLLLLGGGVVLFVLAVVYSVLAIIAQIIYENAIPSTILAVIVGGIVLAIFIAVRRKRNRAVREEMARQFEYERQLEARMSVVRISDNRTDYLISNDDYRRGTPRENFYRKTFLLPLLSVFGNRCARCGSSQNGLDIDHFVFSKNEGGSFAMFHRDGMWVNNAIPLCLECNRKKRDRSYRDFFTAKQLIDILESNVQMTKRLNERGVMSQFHPTAAREPWTQVTNLDAIFR